MREDLLTELKMKLEDIKRRNNEYNNKVKRIRELQKDSYVKEYIKLTGLKADDLKLIRSSDKEIIESFYYGYLHKIKEDDTNGIFVYLGTYAYSSEIDIVHGSSDIRVNYDSHSANYRLYQDIEYSFSRQVLISECEQFEREHTILNPTVYFSNRTYYAIQRDFFVRAIKTDQKSAKKTVFRKYSK